MKSRGLLSFGLSLAILSVEVFPALFPKTALAQSNCQSTVNNVVNQMRAKGVRQASVSIGKGEANQRHTGNPTQRTDVITLTLSPYNQSDNLNLDQQSARKIENILRSPALLKTWADSIVISCKNTAVVRFIQDQSDWVLDYAIQADGKTRKRECIDASGANYIDWNQQVCV